MVGLTACLLGGLAERRHIGKVGTQSDIHLHDFKHTRDVTVLVPHRYPEQIRCLSFCVLGADVAMLHVTAIDASLGEQVLAADAAGIKAGAILIDETVGHDAVQRVVAGTVAEDWKVCADWDSAKDHIVAVEAAVSGPPRVAVDHHFDVRGVGAVILGVVRGGPVRKGQTLHAFPGRVLCPVRSIQVHDVDVPAASPGDRVGLALRNTKAAQLDRGQILAEPDTVQIVQAGDAFNFELRRNAFGRALDLGAVLHLGIGMQSVPIRLAAPAPGPGQTAVIGAVAERPFVWVEGRGVLWDAEGRPRVVGAARIQ